MILCFSPSIISCSNITQEKSPFILESFYMIFHYIYKVHKIQYLALLTSFPFSLFILDTLKMYITEAS
ncbi:hypothetical protein GDO81_016453 [Engystomops pustulosus]|uniref:Uncharacterized protein n=1 Tax=Engystomops pustulosus TaxID=76066 RepID=A0AAV7AT37_ENGPU|nr:hypothetical protein GDO81_016453 [Engystomops pustulosus]